MTTSDEWIQAVRDKLGTGDFDTKVLGSDGIAVKAGYCKCPECGKEQRAWYELPNNDTKYESCEHRHDGIPKSM